MPTPSHPRRAGLWRQLAQLLATGLLLAGLLPAQAGQLVLDTYYHNDHLGSPAAATDERGDLLWRAHYRPYGERQEAPKSERFGNLGYTGHAQDADSQLVYAGARYYDPLIGRFLAVDPAPVMPGAPGSFNRYLYANNNPYAYIDPDGEMPWLIAVALPAFAGMMTHSDMANTPAIGETPQQLGTMDHLGALPGLNAGKGLTALKAAGEAKDAVKVANTGGKYTVGAYNEIKSTVSGLDAHHVGQKALMKDMIPGYDPATAPSILVPKVGHTVKGPNGIVSRSADGLKTPRDVLARDIRELRRVYPDVPNSQLQGLIQMNKSAYPSSFSK